MRPPELIQVSGFVKNPTKTALPRLLTIGSTRELVEPSPAHDHRHASLRPRCPRLHLLRTRDMKDVGLPPSRRERFECRTQLRSCIQPGLQLLGDRIL